jgi:hypothetical protein
MIFSSGHKIARLRCDTPERTGMVGCTDAADWPIVMTNEGRREMQDSNTPQIAGEFADAAIDC